MSYTEEEIKKYLNILSNYKKSLKQFEPKFKCKKCSNRESFSSYSGQYLCLECGQLKGHILGNIELKDFDRLHYQKKSIYHRKYYFDKKIKNISKLINLTDEEKSELYDKLLILNSNNMKILNDQYSRKRMININYVIKKFWRKWDVKNIKILKLKLVLKF